MTRQEKQLKALQDVLPTTRQAWSHVNQEVAESKLQVARMKQRAETGAMNDWTKLPDHLDGWSKKVEAAYIETANAQGLELTPVLRAAILIHGVLEQRDLEAELFERAVAALPPTRRITYEEWLAKGPREVIRRKWNLDDEFKERVYQAALLALPSTQPQPSQSTVNPNELRGSVRTLIRSDDDQIYRCGDRTFALNNTEWKMADLLWKAAKTKERSKKKRLLGIINASGLNYEQVGKVFSSQDGKGFYKLLVDNDTRGFYWLKLNEE